MEITKNTYDKILEKDGNTIIQFLNFIINMKNEEKIEDTLTYADDLGELEKEAFELFVTKIMEEFFNKGLSQIELDQPIVDDKELKEYVDALNKKDSISS